MNSAAEAAPESVTPATAPAGFSPIEAAPPVGETIVNVTPARFLETRSGLTTEDGLFQGVGKRSGGSQLRVQIAGRGDVPADAEGVVVNVTAIEPVANGFISMHPCVDPRPGTSSLNYQGGVNLGNEIVSALAADGSVCVFTRTETHIVLDVVGYVPAGSSLTATDPARFFETRAGLPTVDGQFAGAGPTSPSGTVKIRVAGRGAIPTGIAAVIANVTAVNPGLNGFLSAHACLSTRPPTSSLNYRAGVNRGNEIVIPVDTNGDICIFTLRGIDLTVDVLGYVPPGTNLTPIVGARLVETRPGLSTADGQYAGLGQAAAESQLRVKIAGRAGIPSDATGVILNLTAIDPTTNGFMSVHPCVTPRPTASSLNYATGVTGGNEIIAGLNAAGELCVFTKRATDFTLDVTGYLAPAGADISVTKTDAADPVTPGSTVTYTVTVANAGPRPAADVLATDTMPAGLTFVSTSGCDEDPAGVPTCSLGTIPSGGSVQYTVTATANSTTASTVTNSVSVTSSTTDPNLSNNSTTESTTVNDAPVVTSAANRNAAENQTAAGTLTATDQFVPTQTLTWSETGGADAGKLSITSAGVLTFDAAPDFETPTDANADNVYVINVAVSDGAGGVATQTVRVTVTDVNDAPVITSAADRTALEDQTAVATLTASDQDLPAQTLTWTETGGADAGLLSITAGGVLGFDAAPDFENPTDADTDGIYVIDVAVSDGAGGSTPQTVSVTVTNGNEAPSITSDGGGATAAVDAAENQTAVTDVQSTDPDGETENGGGLTYALTTTGGGDDNDLFTLDTATGLLSFTDAPDFEAPADADTDNDYEVQVTVTDAGSLTDVQDITVTVTDQNDPPEITSDGGGDTATVDAAENQTAVTDVETSDTDDGEGAGLTYSLTGGADLAAFGIDADSGVLTFDAAPNFENPTDADTDNDYEVQVTVTDSGALVDVQDITVTVTDENDVPVITSSAAQNAPENQTAVATLTATDQDLPAQTLTWTETGGADAGLLSITADGVLTFDSPPDFETPTDANTDGAYVIGVQVSDGAGGVLSQTVTVFVTNLNDAPIITSNGGGATAAVNAAENQTTVADVQTFDLEGDTEGDGLTYALTTTAGGGTDNALFDVDTDTGVVTFAAAPDFEAPADADTDNDYDVQVTVTDSATLTDVQDITVTVTDVNEAPEIISDGGGATAAVTAAENQTAVTDVQSSDPEGDIETDGLTYSITGGADQALFDIDADSGELSFAAAPDFEAPADADTGNDYEVQVTVTDSGTLTDVQDVTVTVTNVNEVPSITSNGGAASATVGVDENQTAVTDVQSTDPDGETESGGGLTYSLTNTAGGGTDNDFFTIDEDTGLLTFEAAPSFETAVDANADNDYEVQVTVTDAGALVDFQDITVTVADVEEAPEITSDGGGATAAVNAAENQTAVTDVQSSDPDGETENGGGLVYSLTDVGPGGGIDNDFFTLNTETGLLTFTTAPDFEDPADADFDNDYEVQVTVTDSATLTDVQDITVRVTDANDAPIIISDGGGATAAVNVAENQTAVTDVETFDLEGDIDGDGLTYAFSIEGDGGTDNELFTLIPTSGLLTFTDAPNFEVPADADTDGDYEVQITVTDSGSLTDVQDITVTVTDVNDAPVITSSAAQSADENQTAIATLRATDEDLPAQTLVWAEVGGADAPRVSITTGGVLTFDGAPNFEAPNDANGDGVYVVNVTVYDGVADPVAQTVSVTLTNVNEVPSITSNGAGATAAVEAAENQTAVTDVDSSDLDGETENGGGLTYALTTAGTGGADNGDFTLDTATGLLSFTEAPDFENAADSDFDNDYEVQVTVSDVGGLTDVQDIIVTVTDVNDAPVIAGGPTAEVDAAENQTAVTDVQSSDEDVTGDIEGAGLTYSFTTADGGGADNDLFSLDADTGVLTFTASPNFEIPNDADTHGDYEVQVTVTDSGSLTDTQDITVTVTDENDAPEITTSASQSAAENQTAVSDVDSTDEDGETENLGGLTYSITGGDDDALFEIDTDSGELAFSAPPNFEAPSDVDEDGVYEVEVTVTDAGLLIDTQAMLVTVTDVNDSPVITSSSSQNAPENQRAVAMLTATDEDLPAQTLVWTETGGADATKLSITPGGVVTFDVAPNFESPTDANTDGIYVLNVTVYDGVAPPTPQTLLVTVTDVNDAPVITSNGGAATAAVDAAENQLGVTDVQSSDQDGDTENGGGLTYSLTIVDDGGADNGFFTLNTATGLLTFTDPQNFEDPNDFNADGDYEVQVTVTDGDLTDVQDITVSLTDVNDAPTITSDGGGATAAVNVPENQTVGTDVETFDEDGDTEASGLTYELTGGADQALFSIVGTTGELSFLTAPDHEIPTDADTGGDYEVQVTVTDSGLLTDVQDITITVTNVNEVPTITSNGGGDTAGVNRTENGTFVTDVQSSDLDGQTENGGGLTYSKTTTEGGGADNARFTLNVNTGALTFTTAPDFENPLDVGADNTYEVQITVSDVGGLTDVQDITVTVTDVNEAPVITSSAAQNAPENQTAVATLTATDQDRPAQTLMWSKTGNGADADKLSITTDGVLTLDVAPDFENPADDNGDGVYEIEVQVFDGVDGETTQLVTVTITDVDEAP